MRGFLTIFPTTNLLHIVSCCITKNNIISFMIFHINTVSKLIIDVQITNFHPNPTQKIEYGKVTPTKVHNTRVANVVDEQKYKYLNEIHTISDYKISRLVIYQISRVGN